MGLVDDVRGEGELLDWGGDFVKSGWAEEIEERKDKCHCLEVEDVHCCSTGEMGVLKRVRLEESLSRTFYLYASVMCPNVITRARQVPGGNRLPTVHQLFDSDSDASLLTS